MSTYDQMRSKWRGLLEASQTTIVWTFGRFQPPTAGHQRLIRKVISVARENNAEYRIYPSRKVNRTDNPLDPRTKIKYMKKMFRGVNIVDDAEMQTPFHVAKKLSDEGYKNVIMIVGSDRVQTFKRNISKYINHSDPSKNFAYDSFDVISAGERDPDSDGVSGVSGSKMRRMAAKGDVKEFTASLSGLLSKRDAGNLFNALRVSMGIREDYEPSSPYVTTMRFKERSEFTEFQNKWNVEEEHGAGEEGTPELVATYSRDTPGQPTIKKGFPEKELNEIFAKYFEA